MKKLLLLAMTMTMMMLSGCGFMLAEQRSAVWHSMMDQSGVTSEKYEEDFKACKSYAAIMISIPLMDGLRHHFVAAL